MPWFIRRLKDEVVRYPNPFSGQEIEISLAPEDVHSIVFWSKNYAPFLGYIPELERGGYGFYCHYTITGMPKKLEPNVPDWETSATVFKQLSARTSPRHVQWRFDPILFTEYLGRDWYLDRFRKIAEVLHGYTHRCYFSFANMYSKVVRRLRSQNIKYLVPTTDEKTEMVNAMHAIASSCEIRLYACCQEDLISANVEKARCVDGLLLSRLFPEKLPVTKTNPTRKGCNCTISRDIGVYNTCPHGCIYCYANQKSDKARHRYRSHNRHDLKLNT